MLPNHTAENLLARFSDLEGDPDEVIVSCQKFNPGGNLYYHTPGEFLYQREPGAEEIGSFFCDYLTDEVWHSTTGEEWGE